MQIASIRHKALRRFAETGSPKGLPRSLTVTRNWRMTFRVIGDGAIDDMNLEDYH